MFHNYWAECRQCNKGVNMENGPNALIDGEHRMHFKTSANANDLSS